VEQNSLAYFREYRAAPDCPVNQMSVVENAKIRILLVDDHPFVLEGIRTCLSTQPRFEIVGQALNGEEAVEKSKALRPHVVVMDISMPVMNGLEAARYLRRILPGIRILMLTMHPEEECTSEIIEAGACGFVAKSAPPEELARAIESVHGGQTFFSPECTSAYLKGYVQNAGKEGPGQPPQLSLRERQVLTLIAEGLSNKQAASRLGISVRTVEKHRERIMAKLNLHSVVELTKYAIMRQMIQLK
jgi:DNA-binding NarL/FixJ family response regulator